MTKRHVRTAGFLVLVLGILTSPVKEWAMRCRSNPWGWLEAECEAFQETHWQWGYAILFLGLVLIAASFFTQKSHQETND